MGVPSIDRYTVWNASGNVVTESAQREREEIYTPSAPITTKGYHDLIDAVHRPGGPIDEEVERRSSEVASEIAKSPLTPSYEVTAASIADSVGTAIQYRRLN